MTDKIYNVRISVSDNNFTCNAVKMNVAEKDKTFVTENNGRISKDKLMKIDTIYYENASSIRYHTYCLENDIESAKQMLLNHVASKINKYKESLDATMLQFESLTKHLKTL